MRKETSYGIIPLLRGQGGWRLFLVKHRRDHFWGFPKGHAEKGESPLEAAKRELHEESGLKVLQLLREEPLLEEYSFEHLGTTIEKRVFFYLAITSEECSLDTKEILEGRWLSFAQAKSLISFSEGRRLLEEIEQITKSL